VGSVVFGAAMQTPTPQRDPLQFESGKPALLLWSVKPDRTTDFEAFWAELHAALNSSQLPEIKAFAVTFGRLAKVDVAPASSAAPVQYLVQLPSPSTTQSYHPAKIVFELLFRRNAISRAQADTMFSKLKDLGVLELGAFQSTR
jgi:hypothetical protein